MNILNSLFLAAADAGEISTTVVGLFDVMKIVLTIYGVWHIFSGFVSVADGQKEDNPNAKSRGYKEVSAGIGVILVAWVGVPKISEFVQKQITSAGTSGVLVLPPFIR